MSSVVAVDMCLEVEQKLAALVLQPVSDISKCETKPNTSNCDLTELTSKNVDYDMKTGKVLKLSKFTLQFQGKVGRGTFGTIHSVFNLDKNKQMALKVIKVTNEVEKADCQSEANILMDLTLKSGRKSQFPFYFGNFQYGKSCCILMEKLDCDMYRIMKKRNEPLPVKTCIYLAYQILSALRDLNQMGFAHTDIKPENVMIVNREGKDQWKVKLIDLGVVAKIEEMKKSVGCEIQTYEYRSPEVVFGLPIDETIDVYSVGVMIAEFYSKQELFVVNGEKELARQIVHLVGMPSKVAEAVHFKHYFRKELNEAGDEEIKFKPLKNDPLTKMKYNHSGLTSITKYGFNHLKFATVTPLDIKFASFLSLLMSVDSEKRPSPQDALNHSIFDQLKDA